MEPVRDSYQRLKQFTADASHELRNPIAVIQTNVQVALADRDPVAQYQQLEIIERLTRRLARLLDDLLFLARQDSVIDNSSMEPCNLYRILEQVVEEQQVIAGAKQIDLELSYRDINLLVLGNSDRLIRLFTNLIGNAIAYTPNGGKVSVSYQIVTPQNQVQVLVRDTGVGIPESALPHIFDRFYRHQPQSTGGSGLGLAIAKAIVENHRGQIKVESSPNKGTTFTILLPQVISKSAKL
jgi:OmpR-family two-component system manganese-sensing sensor histidine kinase